MPARPSGARCRHSRARCAFLSPSPLGRRGKGEGGCWRHLEPLGASPLCLRLRLRSAQGGPLPPLLDPLPRRGRAIRKRGCATRVPAAMQRPRAGVTSRRRTPHCRHSPARGASASVILARDARSSFPLPLGGEGRVRGAAGATSSLWVRPPLSLRLRLRGASPLSLILSPVGGEESGKGDARRASLPPCSGHARG